MAIRETRPNTLLEIELLTLKPLDWKLLFTVVGWTLDFPVPSYETIYLTCKAIWEDVGEIQNYYQICFTDFFPAWFVASMMTPFSSLLLMGETTSSLWGFRRQQWNMTLSSGSQTNVCHGHRVVALLPDTQRGNKLHVVTTCMESRCIQ